MTKVDFKLVMMLFALVLLVMLLEDADASRRRSYSSGRRRSFSSGRRRRSFSSDRRRRTSYVSRRRSSYGSSRSRSSTGLITGLVIFFVFAVLIVVGIVIVCCYCRSRRQRNAGTIVTPQPPIQYRTEYQNGSGMAPPPYTATEPNYNNPMMNQSAYPPPVEKNPKMYPPPTGAPYPANDIASPLPYPSDAQNPPAYPPTPEFAPPQGDQAARVAPYPAEAPLSVDDNAPPPAPPSYDDAVKERRSDEAPR